MRLFSLNTHKVAITVHDFDTHLAVQCVLLKLSTLPLPTVAYTTHTMSPPNDNTSFSPATQNAQCLTEMQFALHVTFANLWWTFYQASVSIVVWSHLRPHQASANEIRTSLMLVMPSGPDPSIFSPTGNVTEQSTEAIVAK